MMYAYGLAIQVNSSTVLVKGMLHCIEYCMHFLHSDKILRLLSPGMDQISPLSQAQSCRF
jgi:hypothetical protein